MELRYDISVVGEQNIRRALRGVESEIQSSGRRAQATASKASGTARSARSSDREALAGIRRVEREQLASARKTERERIAAEKRVERERIASEKSVGREQLKQEQYWANARARSRHADMQARDAKVANRRASASSFAGGVGNSIKGALGTVAGIGGTVLGVAGLAGAGEAVSQEIDIDRRVRQAVVNARGPGESGMDPKDLRKQVRNTAMSTGATESGLVGAVETYTARTGDIKTATENLRTFATVAMATGASVEDVASTAADLAQKFNITKPREMADAFAVLAFQGKKGAFELRDMASTFPEMAAAAQRAGMTGVGGMKTLGGLAQIARTSTGSGAEASTAVQMLMTQLTAKAGDLKSGKALGGKTVNVFEKGDATKPARDIRQVLAEIISKSRGNLTQLGELFDVRGVRAASPMIAAYRSASASAGGGSKGEAAGKAAVLKLIADASDQVAKFSDVQADATEVAKSDAVKLEKVNTRLREAFSEKLLPALERLLPKFEEIIPQLGAASGAFADLVAYFSDNPFKGVGAVVLAKVGLDLAEAGIGAAVRTAIVALMAPGAVGSAAGAIGAGAGAAAGGAGRLVSGLAGGATATLGAAGAVAASGLAAAGGLAFAGYAGKQLYDVTEGFSDFGGGGGRALTPAEYDAKKASGGMPSNEQNAVAAAAQQKAAEATSSAARELSAAAKNLLASNADTNRSKPIVAR